METNCEVCGQASPYCEPCDLCKLVACPDCLGEADCCFIEVDDHEDDPSWAPPGWAVVKSSGDRMEWQRIAD